MGESQISTQALQARTAADSRSAWFAAICADLDRGYFKSATPAAAFRRPVAAPASALWV